VLLCDAELCWLLWRYSSKKRLGIELLAAGCCSLKGPTAANIGGPPIENKIAAEMQESKEEERMAANSSGEPSSSNAPPVVAADEDDESVLDLADQTNRPQDVALNQQRVNAWHPILDPVWVIVALFYLGVILVPVGACVL